MATGYFDFDTSRESVDASRTPTSGQFHDKRSSTPQDPKTGVATRLRDLWNSLRSRLRAPAREEDSFAEEVATLFDSAPCTRFSDNLDFAEVAAAGRAEGAQLLPNAASDSQTDSVFLSRVVAEANAAAVLSRALFMRAVSSSSREITRPPFDVRSSIQNIVNRTVEQIERIENDARNELVARSVTEVEVAALVRKWVGDQGHWLDRIRPEQPNLLVTMAFITLCLAIETVGNALTLQDSFPDGLHGAIIISLCLAGLNIAFGLLAGFAFGRCRHHAIGATRLFGWTQSLLCGLLAAVLLFGVAGARHETIVLNEPFETALGTSGLWVLTHPGFIIVDLKSAVLWLIGIILWLLAYAEGHRAFSDPYPDFTRQTRRIEQAAKEADDCLEGIREEQDGVVEKAQAEIQDLYVAMEAYGERQRAELGAYERALKFMAAQRGIIHETVARAFRCYASENRRCRGDVPSPIWFGRVPNLSFDWPNFREDAFDSYLASTHRLTEEIYASVTDAFDDLDAACRRSRERLEDARRAALGSPARSLESPLPPPTDSQLRRGH